MQLTMNKVPLAMMVYIVLAAAFTTSFAIVAELDSEANMHVLHQTNDGRMVRTEVPKADSPDDHGLKKQVAVDSEGQLDGLMRAETKPQVDDSGELHENESREGNAMDEEVYAVASMGKMERVAPIHAIATAHDISDVSSDVAEILAQQDVSVTNENRLADDLVQSNRAGADDVANRNQEGAGGQPQAIKHDASRKQSTVFKVQERVSLMELSKFSAHTVAGRIEAEKIAPRNSLISSSNTSMKVAVAIATKDRIGYVRLCADAIKDTIPGNDIWIFDDASTEYSVTDLQKWFDTPHVQSNAKSVGPDIMGSDIVKHFVNAKDYDWLVTLDSDLIVLPGWRDQLSPMLGRMDGVVSIYHSALHHTKNCVDGLCEMDALGNAGCVWSRTLAEQMIAVNTPSYWNSAGGSFDWGWVRWLREQNKKMYSVEKALAMHIGMHGSHGRDSAQETAVGYDMQKLPKGLRDRAQYFLNGESPSLSAPVAN